MAIGRVSLVRRRVESVSDSRSDVPNWHDISPRFEFVWDVQGNGKTAVKVGTGKYVRAYSTGFAETYDPAFLEKLGVHGFVPDLAMARSWYEKARAFGSAEAPQRLEKLASKRQ